MNEMHLYKNEISKLNIQKEPSGGMNKQQGNASKKSDNDFMTCDWFQ